MPLSPAPSLAVEPATTRSWPPKRRKNRPPRPQNSPNGLAKTTGGTRPSRQARRSSRVSPTPHGAPAAAQPPGPARRPARQKPPYGSLYPLVVESEFANPAWTTARKSKPSTREQPSGTPKLHISSTWKAKLQPQVGSPTFAEFISSFPATCREWGSAPSPSIAPAGSACPDGSETTGMARWKAKPKGLRHPSWNSSP